MVEITCPHCSGDLELPDGAFGDFECPMCEGEFVWGQQPVEVVYNLPKEKGLTKVILNIIRILDRFHLICDNRVDYWIGSSNILLCINPWWIRW